MSVIHFLHLHTVPTRRGVCRNNPHKHAGWMHFHCRTKMNRQRTVSHSLEEETVSEEKKMQFAPYNIHVCISKGNVVYGAHVILLQLNCKGQKWSIYFRILHSSTDPVIVLLFALISLKMPFRPLAITRSCFDSSLQYLL